MKPKGAIEIIYVLADHPCGEVEVVGAWVLSEGLDDPVEDMVCIVLDLAQDAGTWLYRPILESRVITSATVEMDGKYPFRLCVQSV